MINLLLDNLSIYCKEMGNNEFKYTLVVEGYKIDFGDSCLKGIFQEFNFIYSTNGYLSSNENSLRDEFSHQILFDSHILRTELEKDKNEKFQLIHKKSSRALLLFKNQRKKVFISGISHKKRNEIVDYRIEDDDDYKRLLI